MLAAGAGQAQGHPVDTPPGHTGGFGEPTCAECHAGYPVNPPDGALRLSADNNLFRPGQRLKLNLQLSDPDMRRAGFELSARYAAGALRGQDAGGLDYPLSRDASSAKLRLINGKAGHTYLVHEAGGRVIRGLHSATWQIEWAAPANDRPQCAVIFDVAANASDDDESPFGDRIYTTQLALPPAQPDEDCSGADK